MVQCEYPSNWLGKVQGACGLAHRAADANQQWIAQQIAKPAQRMAHRAGGLERLAANDLSVRLPDFDLAELSRINVFNHLANSLEFTLAERNELAKRLIAVQGEERQTLARELHDEFGQCLAAISAMAAAIGQTAQVDCPALMPECGLGGIGAIKRIRSWDLTARIVVFTNSCIHAKLPLNLVECAKYAEKSGACP